MFKKAKLHLTFWYLAIIMAISVGFSAVMYAGVNNITQRALQAQRERIERHIMDAELGRPTPRFIPILDESALIEARERTLFILVIINLGILCLSAGLGYFLAGKTLAPIESMLNKQKRFISDAAHELKTPLTAMKTDLEVTLRDPNLSIDDSKKALKGSIDEIDKLNVFVINLLKKSKYQLGEIPTEYQTFNVADVVKSVTETLEPISKAKGLNLNLSLNDSIVKADKTDMTELAQNLIENAIKYSEKGDIQVKLFSQATMLTFEVIDQGIGMSEEQTQAIFEPFYKIEQSRGKGYEKGFGLGLAIVDEIVRKYKGTIHVNSKPNEGTTFTVNLPIIQDSLRKEI